MKKISRFFVIHPLIILSSVMLLFICIFGSIKVIIFAKKYVYRANAVSDVEIVKSGSVGSISLGGSINYTLTITNHATVSLKDLLITDPLPNNTQFISASDGGTYANGNVTWNIASLAAGASKSVNLTVKYLGPLAQPNNLTATNIYATQAKINWNDNSTDEQGFLLERSTDASFTNKESYLSPANTANFIDAGLTPTTQYYYRASAYQFNDITGPGVPSNFSAVPISSWEIRLNWTDNSSFENGFVIERSKQEDFTNFLSIFVPQNSNTYLDHNLEASTAYYYRMKAVSYARMSQTSSTIPVLTNQTLVAPSNLVATAISANKINLTWQNNNGGGANRVKIERATNANFTNSVYYQIGATASFEDGALNSNTTYYFRVFAFNDNGGGINLTSSASGTAIRATPTGGTSLAPTNLQATIISSTQINLNWTNNSSVNNFTVDCSTDSTFNSNVKRHGFGENLAELRDLTPNTTYYFRVLTFISPWFTDPSNIISKTTPTLSVNAPSNLQGTIISSTQINLTWTDNSSDEIGFTIDRSTDSTFNTGVVKGGVGSNQASSQMYNLTPNTTYFFRVSAYADSRSSGYSDIVTKATPASYLNPPSNLTATAISSTQIRLNWTDNSTIEKQFILQWSLNSNFVGGTGMSVEANATTITISSLTPGTKYYFRITALGDTETLPSNTANATTSP